MLEMVFQTVEANRVSTIRQAMVFVRILLILIKRDVRIRLSQRFLTFRAQEKRLEEYSILKQNWRQIVFNPMFNSKPFLLHVEHLRFVQYYCFQVTGERPFQCPSWWKFDSGGLGLKCFESNEFETYK